MPEKQRKESLRSLRVILNDQEAEKRRGKVTEGASRCPKGGKKRAQGHRQSLSMPERQKKENSWSLREILNSREAEKRELPVTERGQGSAITLGDRQANMWWRCQ
jgi:5-methylcytosine-specific restriction endonuclease McrBC GTP-binding regulatory subunit McrB